MTWHVDEMSAQMYAQRGLDAVGAASVESHLLACDQCRLLIGHEVDDTLLDSVWFDLTDILDQPRVGIFERVLLGLGCGDAAARLMVSSGRNRWSFLLAFTVSLLLAVTAAVSSDEQYFGLYLIVAPLGPLVATAGAFGRWADPAHMLATTSPTSVVSLLLIRLVASVVPAVGLTALSVPWVADRGWIAVAWLLPSLALAAGALALSSWVDVERAAFLLGLAWLVPPVVLRLPFQRLLDMLGTPTQLLSAVAVTVALGIIAVRIDTFDRWEA